MAVEQPQMAVEFTGAPNNLQPNSAPDQADTVVNPLAKHFRTPSIQIALPSGGKFWGLGSLKTTSTGEYPVYPMTARDEILFNNPDALLNGQAVVDVVKSCIPNITNPWAIPSIDVDRVLIAIRIASFGEEMEFTTVCPREECLEENEYSIDLKTFIDRKIDISIFTQTWEYAGLVFQFRPQTYKELNQLNMETFDQQRLFETVADDTLDEEVKLRSVNELITRMTDRTVEAIAGSIESIQTPDGHSVTHRAHIIEFLENCDRKTFTFVSECMGKINTALGLNEVEIECEACHNKYKTPFTFDNANFFATDS